MLRRLDNWFALHRIWLAFATAAFFPVAVVSAGVTVGAVTNGSVLFAALAFPVALVSFVVVGHGVRHAIRRGDGAGTGSDAGNRGD